MSLIPVQFYSNFRKETQFLADTSRLECARRSSWVKKNNKINKTPFIAEWKSDLRRTRATSYLFFPVMGNFSVTLRPNRTPSGHVLPPTIPLDFSRLLHVILRFLLRETGGKYWLFSALLQVCRFEHEHEPITLTRKDDLTN